jgi:hypothetical protein
MEYPYLLTNLLSLSTSSMKNDIEKSYDIEFISPRQRRSVDMRKK